jgi:hypothetical protein
MSTGDERPRLVSLPGGKDPHKAEALAFWSVQAAVMRDLLTSPLWEAYATQLGGLEHNWIETMITASDPQAYAYAQGFIRGLRTAHNLPASIVAKTEQSQQGK